MDKRVMNLRFASITFEDGYVSIYGESAGGKWYELRFTNSDLSFVARSLARTAWQIVKGLENTARSAREGMREGS